MKLLYFHTGRIEENKANVIQALQMCCAFSEIGLDVTLAINSFTLDNPEARARAARKLGRPDLPFTLRVLKGRTYLGRLKSLGCRRAAMEMAATIDHDITFVRDSILVPFLAKDPAPLIFEAHNNVAFAHGGPLDLIWRNKIISLARSGKIKLFVPISQALGNWWASKGMPMNKICPQHDAVDPSLFSAKEPRDEARKALGFPLEGKSVLYAGSLYKDRGIEDVLELAKRRPDTRFVLVGGPDPAKCEYEELARHMGLNNVTFTGYVAFAKIPRYLASADILLMVWSRRVPTIGYCSPLKLFEYMAAERIIVGHGFPTIREVLEHRKHAYLADPDSFDDLASKLDDAIDAPQHELAVNARELVMKEYTWKRRCEKILARFSTDTD